MRLFEKFKAINEKITGLFFKLDAEVQGALIAVLSRENYLLVGPPGTAKTTLVYTISKILNARWFYRQLTKFTDLEEILGPIDVAKLLEGKVERIYANSIVNAEFALLDEIFNASSAILNTLLSILNERVVYDGDKVVPVKTWTVFGASNRIPDEEELQALYDRFPLRAFLEWARPEDTEQLLVKGWELRGALEGLTPMASMNDVKEAHKAIVEYVKSNIKELTKVIGPILASYVEHIPISNRTRVKVPLYVVSYLVINGFDPFIEGLNPTLLRIATLKVLRYLVSSKEQLNDYNAFVMAHMPEDLLQINELINEAKALVNNELYDEARQRLNEAKGLLTKIKGKWNKSVLSLFASEIEELENAINRIESSLSSN